jgi:hypothetical protein
MEEELSRINLELTAAREAYQQAKVSFQVASDLHKADQDIARSDSAFRSLGRVITSNLDNRSVVV